MLQEVKDQRVLVEKRNEVKAVNYLWPFSRLQGVQRPFDKAQRNDDLRGFKGPKPLELEAN